MDVEYYSMVDKDLFLIVHQLICGKELICKAGECSIQTSAFGSALTYLKAGLSMLKPNELFT
eukprot:12512194-Ditylum_brightwellii.AAC.1